MVKKSWSPKFYRTLNTGLLKPEGTKHLTLLVLDLSIQRPTFPILHPRNGSDVGTEPEMTDRSSTS